MSCFISTAISYCNAPPHIGHVYENIIADFLKRQFELLGRDVKLMTGTDEHGKKIQTMAEKDNKVPKEFCDQMVKYFIEMNGKYNINYDHFLRTTDEYHKNLVQHFIKKSYENGDIYKGEYKGYYSIREESFVTDETAKINDYKDPVTNQPYDYIIEESYFFRMSKYLEKIKEIIDTLHPPQYKQIISERLEKLDELKDLSISRTSFDWGIPFPGDEEKIVYVWFDALFCYLSSMIQLYGTDNKPDKIIHIIGKDIVWFHNIIYTAMLKSVCKEYYPTTILVHGFITDKDGKKMSKSVGNVISPQDLDKYPTDAIRFYVLTETSLGDDLNFSVEKMMDKYNCILINEFGNLVQRIGNLVYDYKNDINKLSYTDECQLIEIMESINDYDIIKYYNLVFNKIKYLNALINQEKPWDKNVNYDQKIQMLKQYLYQLNIITKLMYPYIPNKILEIRDLFGFSHNLNLNDNKIDKLNITYEKKQVMFQLVNRKEKMIKRKK